ncbi:hypothetical protein AVEN_4185-1 [Araneus ventricosus]|uniref:Uncharacterized protein n=1 Tax=Araneus ventricosus TaxID=182803 RepID=A0A4Y2WAN8_ARAVE|nr:hypothetical protein AVEN_4185-1 [Araneus ventricosus]
MKPSPYSSRILVIADNFMKRGASIEGEAWIIIPSRRRREALLAVLKGTYLKQSFWFLREQGGIVEDDNLFGNNMLSQTAMVLEDTDLFKLDGWVYFINQRECHLLRHG